MAQLAIMDNQIFLQNKHTFQDKSYLAMKKLSQ